MSKWQLIIGLISMAVGAVGTVVCGIITTVLHFMNPDMTNYRFMLEHPQWAIMGFGFALMAYGGYQLAVYAARK